VLQHLDNPRLAFSDMLRVARPGARIVVVEPDYGTLALRGADPTVTREILNTRCNHFRSGMIGRQLLQMFKQATLCGVTMTIATAETTQIGSEGERLVLRNYVAAAEAIGVVSPTEGATWLRDLEESAREGRYRRALTVFLVSGRKP